jgi:DNA repair protein RecN (Recombination protein N)
VRALDDAERVAELARMLAGLDDTDTGRAHAEELLAAARAHREKDRADDRAADRADDRPDDRPDDRGPAGGPGPAGRRGRRGTSRVPA